MGEEPGHVEILPVTGLGEVTEADDLGALIAAAASDLRDDDIVVVAQKVVSKAEGRLRYLDAVEVGERAQALAAELDKDPRLVELVLAESRRIVRARRGVLIVETHGGWICANAGIDASNVPGEDIVTLLPEDADASARRIRASLRGLAGVAPAVIVADSFGRPWRLGQVDVAIGCAGLSAIDDWRGRPDRLGRELTATAPAIADEVAAAADLARDKASGVPVVIVRGLGTHRSAEDGPGAATLRRADDENLFR